VEAAEDGAAEGEGGDGEGEDEQAEDERHEGVFENEALQWKGALVLGLFSADVCLAGEWRTLVLSMKFRDSRLPSFLPSSSSP